MADIEEPTWRCKLKVGRVLNRVQAHAEGLNEMTSTQLKAAELFLRKTVPDLNRTELTGKDGGAIEHKNITKSDADILAQYINNKKDNA